MKTIWRPKYKSCIVYIAMCLAILFTSFVFWFYLSASPISYIWVMDAGDFLDQTYLVKMCSNGRRLWQIQFGQSGAIGYDPNQEMIWAPEMGDTDQIHYNQVVKMDTDGNVVDRIQGYRTNDLAVDPNDGSVWVQKLVQNPNQPSEVLIAKIASNGKFLFSVKGALPLGMGIWAMALDPHDGTLWVGSLKKLIHLDREGSILFETSDVSFFSNGPHQIAVHPTNGDVWYTAGITGGITRMTKDGTLLTGVFGFSDPIAIAIHPRDDSVWIANYDQPGTGSVTKISQGGEVLFNMKTPSHAHIVGINPHDGAVWVGFEGGMILLDHNGKLLHAQGGFHKPVSLAFGQPRNMFEAFFNCVSR